MTYDTYLDLLLVAEILMIVHLAGDKSVGTRLQGLVEQEISCPTTDGNLADRTAQQLIAQAGGNANKAFRDLATQNGIDPSALLRDLM